MNRQQIISSLNKIANTLDQKSFYNEANSLTYIMTKIANVNDIRRHPLEMNFSEEYATYKPLTDKAKTVEQAEKQEQKYHKILISLINLYKNYIDEETYNKIFSYYYSEGDIPGYTISWRVEKYFWRGIRNYIIEHIVQSRKDQIRNLNSKLQEQFEKIKKTEMEKISKEYNAKIHKMHNISGTKGKFDLGSLDAAIEHYGLLFEYANDRTQLLKERALKDSGLAAAGSKLENTSLQPTQQDFQENNENLDISNDVQK